MKKNNSPLRTLWATWTIHGQSYYYSFPISLFFVVHFEEFLISVIGFEFFPSLYLTIYLFTLYFTLFWIYTNYEHVPKEKILIIHSIFTTVLYLKNKFILTGYHLLNVSSVGYNIMWYIHSQNDGYINVRFIVYDKRQE